MPHDQAYLEAEKKIEEARRSGATELDLSNMQLTELPESIGQLTHLLKLDIGSNSWRIDKKNQLTKLPESLSQFTQLQTLDLSSNQLTVLPEWLSQLIQLQTLNLSRNQLTSLPEWLGQLIQLQTLYLNENQFKTLPESLGNLKQLTELELWENQITVLPESFSQLTNLRTLGLGRNKIHALPNSIYHLTKIEALWIDNFSQFSRWVRQLKNLETLHSVDCGLDSLPEWIGDFSDLRSVNFSRNSISDIPESILQLDHLTVFSLENNPLNPELAEAYAQGLGAVKLYLRLKSGPQIILNEAKLILVGEGEVGKSCLMDALLGNPWQEHPSTHGIEISPVKLILPETQTELILNGWDFGGQRVYRPTHQLFFSAPAVYLVIWKPREGPQQGFVKEWIKLVKHREPEAKILVVATHGGPQQRQPDIDRQELWDLFGRETVLDFFFVDSKPDENGKRKGIEELKRAIARIAAQLPGVGRSVPKSFAEVRTELKERNVPYLPLDEIIAICRNHKMDDEIANLFITISHRLGHLTHYQHDPILRDIVILRPDWLATAMSYVLDDEETRQAHGLVRCSRLAQLWEDPNRPVETRYPEKLHQVFVRLMERFDLSYRVADPTRRNEADPQILIAQLVPDNRPEVFHGWVDYPADGNIEQMQICRIVDDKGQSANAEGLFYQLIVRLHRYSLGRLNYRDSVHWQRGLVLDDDYNGRALLEHKGYDVHITVRAPYPERFLTMLTEEVKYLVESFWEGLRCNVMVPCLNPEPCIGLFEVSKLIENLKRKRPEQPCPVCNEWQSIEQLLHNAPAASRSISLAELQLELAPIKDKLDIIDTNTQSILSRVDQTYVNLLKVFTDEAKEGPRLFSFVPVSRTLFNPRQWTSAKFRLTLWCEHSRKPLPILNGEDNPKGVYEIELSHEWFKKAAPLLKVVTGTLSLVLPVATAGVKLAMNEATYKAIENQLDFSKEIIDASLTGSEEISEWLSGKDDALSEYSEAIRAQGSTLRELHTLLKAKDPSFGGLVRVLNKRQEFLWVHPQFEKEY